MNKIILHAGTFKTGTTTLQNYLNHNRKKLDEKGINYPQPVTAPGMKAHHELSAWADIFKEKFSVLSHFDITDEKQKLEFDSRVESYYKKVLKNTLKNKKSLLLSSEFIFDLNKDGIKKLKKLLSDDPREIEIIVYLRRADLFSISAYKHYIWTGAYKTTRPVFNDNSCLLRFRKKLEEFIDVFGKKSLVIKAFDKKRFINADLIDDFLSFLGIDESGLERVQKENEALSSLEAKVLLECLNYIPPFIRKGNKELRNPAWYDLTRRVKALGIDGETDMLVSRDEAFSFYTKFKPDYCWIKDTFLPDSPYPTLFDEDFSMYNEEYSAPEFTFKQAVEILVKVWEKEYRERVRQEK